MGHHKIELTPVELQSLIESIDCLKTKIAFTKGLSSTEKKDKLVKADALERKLLDARSSGE
jgi:hypothetical protein